MPHLGGHFGGPRVVSGWNERLHWESGRSAEVIPRVPFRERVLADSPTPLRPPPPLALPRPQSRTARGLGGSLAFHLFLLLLLFVAHNQGASLFSAENTAGDPLLGLSGGGGGGGRVVKFVGLASATPSPTPAEVKPLPPPIPVPELEPAVVPTVVAAIEVAVTNIPVPSAINPSLMSGSSGTGSGGGSGTGTGIGAGSGEGPGSGSGTGGGGGGGSARPPEPRQLILPPLDFPKVMRGRTVSVTFWVGADGRVVRVALEPEIPDRGFAKKFEDVMRNYRFRPARSASGDPISGTTIVSVSF